MWKPAPDPVLVLKLAEALGRLAGRRAAIMEFVAEFDAMERELETRSHRNLPVED